MKCVLQRQFRLFFVAADSSLYTGTPVVGNWLKLMESEHCERSDSLLSFPTSNYGITTTPAKEWKITTNQDDSLADMGHHRRLPNTEELCQSEAAVKAKLSLAEVTAIVLYTGPMVSPPCALALFSCASPNMSDCFCCAAAKQCPICFCFSTSLHIGFFSSALPCICTDPLHGAPRRRSLLCTTRCCVGGPRWNPSAGTNSPRPSTCWCLPSSS